MEKLFLLSDNDCQPIDFDIWLEGKAETLQPIATQWFEAILACGPDVKAVFHDGHPIGCIESAPFAYVNAYTAHVNLGFFYGAFLPDELGLLEGSGKRMRHVKLRPGQGTNEAALKRLLEIAYADIKERLWSSQ